MCAEMNVFDFAAHALGAVSACGGFCKRIPYLLMIVELGVVQIASEPLPVRSLRCALRSGHRTPALSFPDDTAQRSTRTGTTDGSVLLQAAGAQEFVAQVLLFAQTSQERLA